ncbi:MAG: type IVB secretion system protein IcmO/DotL [Alphaproteobacteria bacterium]
MSISTPGLDSKYQYKPQDFLRDTRPMGARLAEGLRTPYAAGGVLGLCLMIAIMFVPGATEFLMLIGGAYAWWVLTKKQKLPLRLPMTTSIEKDYGNLQPGTGKPGKPEGIFFIGNEMAANEQLWITNSDARTHLLILGTTGSGKTETLLSVSTNAMTWGSGFLYTDGKGDSSLWGKVYSLARRFGRDDDVLVLNFMTGNADGDSGSNTTNPFNQGSSSAMTEMIVSLMDDGGKDGDMWKGRAIGMISAIMVALTELREKGRILLNVNAIRNHLSLPKITDLYLDRHGTYDLTPRAKEALKGYLDSLPGFDWAAAERGEPQSSTTNDQHGFLYMQFTRIMGSLAETYGYIFGAEIGDIDFYDVVINRRILSVLLPALEKSEDELANLGKIVVAMLKGMMATTLGSAIEGDWGDVIDTKPTNSSTPFIAILDEVGYYTVPGMAVMAAQARSLGFCIVFAAQDLAAMKMRVSKEAESIVANTNFKLFMKLEDPDDTKEMFRKAAGGTTVTQTSGFAREASSTFMNYYDMHNTSVTVREKADFVDLKDQLSGQAYILSGSKLLRANLFYANPPTAKRLRYNKFLIVRSPDTLALGAGPVDTVISRLSDASFRAMDAEPAKPTVGEILVTSRFMNEARKVKPMQRSAAAIAAVTKAVSGVDIYGAMDGYDPEETRAGYSDEELDKLEREFDDLDAEFSIDDMPRTAMGDAAPAGAADEDLFRRLWGAVSNDVVNGLKELTENSYDGDAGEADKVLERVSGAAMSALDYPDGPPPPRQVEEAVLGAVLHLQDVLRNGLEGAEGLGDEGGDDDDDFDWDIDTDWSIDGDWGDGEDERV